MTRGVIFLLCLPVAYAQLIPAGRPLPRSTKLPVVFLNGYLLSCSGSTFASTFGTSDQYFQRNGFVITFFDNCTFPNRPTIEELSIKFGDFLQALRYEDGQPVPQVDVVAHSLGGLIIRSYMAGKQTADGAFTPPAETHIRKVVFLATPHFGTTVASLAGDTQAQELLTGSRFIFDLATWNQGTDDLRGVDALSIIGDAGNGLSGTRARFDDSVTPLTSGSLGFVQAQRTRIVPYCHTTGGIVTLACIQGAPGIAEMNSDSHLAARATVSFLNGTDEWKTVGQTPEQNSFLATGAGLHLRLKNAQDQLSTLDSASATASNNQQVTFTVRAGQTAFNELVPADTLNLSLRSGSTTLTEMRKIAPGAAQALVLKPGPLVGGVFPAAAAVFPLVLAPGMFVSIYGLNLAALAADAGAPPYPLKLGDTEVFVNSTAVPLSFAGPTQVNAVLPESASGIARLRVKTAAGEHAVNIWVEAALPTVFLREGRAAARNALTNAIVTPDAPLHAGDYVSIYLTGLGKTTVRGDGLNWADQSPTVKLGGQTCTVLYAGRAPGYPGLDQINCQLDKDIAGDPQAPVVVTSGGRRSQPVTLPVI